MKSANGTRNDERRKYPRYDTELKVYFQLKYEIRTRVKFQIMRAGPKSRAGRKYSGLSKNVSVEGMCFVSRKKLKKEALLFIEVYEPRVKSPVKMEGEVRWSKKISGETKDAFHTGVRLISVNGKPVSDSIYFDNKYNVMWSVVLESLFGDFAAALRKFKSKGR